MEGKARSSLARSLASSVPEPTKVRAPSSKRRGSRSNSQTTKAPYPTVTGPSFESRLGTGAQATGKYTCFIITVYCLHVDKFKCMCGFFALSGAGEIQ